VNRSDATFTVDQGRLVYGLGALKNVGSDAMRLIVEARGKKPFVTLFDFARRVDLKRVGKRPLEMLARAGAFDELDVNRRRVFDGLEALVGYSAAVHESRASSQVSLFGEGGDDLPEPRLLPVADWMPAERLAEEHKAIGFYLSGHPLDDYLRALRRRDAMTLAELQGKAERHGAAVARVGVIVSALQERKSGRGTRFFRMNISDPTGQVSGMALFPDDFDAVRRVFDQTVQVVMTLEARFNEGQFDPVARSVTPLETFVADAGSAGLKIFIEEPEAVGIVARVLADAAEKARGMARGPIQFCLIHPDLPGEVEIDTGVEYPVTPQIKGAIKSLPGVILVEEV